MYAVYLGLNAGNNLLKDHKEARVKQQIKVPSSIALVNITSLILIIGFVHFIREKMGGK